MDNKETLINHIEDTPKLRFPEFKEKWKEILLSEIADKVVDKNNNLQYKEIFTNSAEYGVVSQKDFFVNDIITPVNLNKYYIVKENDFVYNPRISNSAPVGPININKLNKIGIMSPLYLIFHTHDIDTIYLENFFKSDHWHSYMLFNGNSGARLDRFSIKDSVFFDMQIFVPSYLEQQKIGTFLSKVDSLIRLYEKKLILLNKYKRGLLFKIFTSFNRDNLISLKELIDKNVIEIKRGNIIPKQYGIYPVYSSSVHNNGLFCYSDNYMFDEELVSWSIDGGGNFFYRPKHKFSLTNVSGYIRVKDKNILNTQYLYYNLAYSSCNYNFDYQNKALPSYISKLYQIYLLDIKIQNKVSTILSSFDFIIKKEEQILLQLKQYKQGLLQQMFI